MPRRCAVGRAAGTAAGARDNRALKSLAKAEGFGPERVSIANAPAAGPAQTARSAGRAVGVPERAQARGRGSEAHSDDDKLAATFEPTAVGLGPRWHYDRHRPHQRRPADRKGLMHHGLMHGGLTYRGLSRRRLMQRGLRRRGLRCRGLRQRDLRLRSGHGHRHGPILLDGLLERDSGLDQLRARKPGQSSNSAEQHAQQNESA